MPLTPGSTLPAVNLSNSNGDALTVGKPAVVSFVKSSCPTCALTMPYMDALDRAVSDTHATVAIVSQEREATATEFAGRCGVSLPILDDSALSASTAMDVQNVPTTYLIDADGHIQDVVIGLDKAGLNRLATTLADWVDLTPEVIAPEDDGSPVWQPG